MLRTVVTVLAVLGILLTNPALAEEAIFSSQPIDPKNPPTSVSTFQAPEPIYCLLRSDKPWKQLLGPHTDYLITYFFLDGEQKAYRTIALKRPELLERSDFLLDIAPDPSRMTAYRDRDIVYGTKDGLRFGPELFTKYLGELGPGTHKVRVEVKAYGDVYAQGEFTLEGSDFSGYQALHQRIRGAAAGAQTMPRAGLSNPTLEGSDEGPLDARRLEPDHAGRDRGQGLVDEPGLGGQQPLRFPSPQCGGGRPQSRRLVLLQDGDLRATSPDHRRVGSSGGRPDQRTHRASRSQRLEVEPALLEERNARRPCTP